MRPGFIAFDKGEVIRNIGVERRQPQLDGLRFVLPVSERLLANLIHLIRRIDKVGRLVMRLLGADIPDTGVLRGHHRQPVFDRLRVVLVGNIHHVQRMLDRHPDHGVRQPFHVVHVAVDRRIAEIQRQHMRQFVEIAFVDALSTQEVEVAENGRRHFIAVRQAFVGEGG